MSSAKCRPFCSDLRCWVNHFTLWGLDKMVTILLTSKKTVFQSRFSWQKLSGFYSNCTEVCSPDNNLASGQIIIEIIKCIYCLWFYMQFSENHGINNMFVNTHYATNQCTSFLVSFLCHGGCTWWRLDDNVFRRSSPLWREPPSAIWWIPLTKESVMRSFHVSFAVVEQTVEGPMIWDIMTFM